MKELVRTLFLECVSTGRTAVIPPLHASAVHWRGSAHRLRWSDYYDWSSIPVARCQLETRTQLEGLLRSAPALIVDPLEPVPHAAPDIVVRHRPDPNFFDLTPPPPHPPAFLEPAFSSGFPSAVRAVAGEIAKLHGPFAGVLHVRRGDLAGPETEPAAVLAHLSARGTPPDAAVYLFSNERDPAWFEALRAVRPRLIVEPMLAALFARAASPRDDYFRLRVGQCLQTGHDHLRLGSMRFMRSVPGSRPTLLGRIRRRLSLRFRGVDLVWLRAQSSLPAPRP